MLEYRTRRIIDDSQIVDISTHLCFGLNGRYLNSHLSEDQGVFR